MKKLVLILGITSTLFSCTKDEEPVKNCECNRVVEVLTMSVVGTTSGKTTYYKYTTINDCTGIQRSSGWSSQSVSKGDCR